MPLPRALDGIASRFGEKTALRSAEGALGFAQLTQASAAVAGRLAAAGVQRGDRVAVFTDHASEAAAALWGVWAGGGVAVPVNGRAGAPALASILGDCRPAATILCGRFGVEDLPELPADCGAGHVMRLEPDDVGPSMTASAAGSLPELSDTDLAAIVYTSGSTGVPKGVCLSHGNLLASAASIIEHVPETSEDSYLMLVPLHYVHGLMQLIVHALAGATVDFAGDFVFPGEVVRMLAERRCVETSGTPWHVSMLINRGGLLEADLPSWKRLGIVGGKMPAEQLARIVEARPEVEVLIAYGQTECAPRATALLPARIARKPDSVGSPIPGVRVHVLDERGEPRPVGEIGEVLVEGPNVMVGYWGRPEETARVVDEAGRLRTGDLGWVDEEGDLHLVGRVDDMIKSAGERIFPGEIERVLRACSDLADAAVVGVPDELLGQRIEAHVVLGPGGTAGDDRDALATQLRRHCLGELPLQRIPKAFHVWPEFPRLASGKVDRVALTRSDGQSSHAG
ncbi:MAG: class I adenylate-forming enzyme family protein [Planctomycetota bacterium]